MAKYRTIAGVEHTVYESMEEFKASNPDGLVNLDWRNGQEGDWVLADDGFVMQVLRRGKVSSSAPREYIRTVTGSFPIWSKGRLDSEFRDNIYSFSKHPNCRGRNNYPGGRQSGREKAFVSFIVVGYDPVEAYLKAFRTVKRTVARQRAYILLAEGDIVEAIIEQVEKAGKDSGATLQWAMKIIKTTVEETDKETLKIKGAGMIADLHTKGKSPGFGGTGMIEAFQGFKELPPEETRQIEGQ